MRRTIFEKGIFRCISNDKLTHTLIFWPVFYHADMGRNEIDIDKSAAEDFKKYVNEYGLTGTFLYPSDDRAIKLDYVFEYSIRLKRG